MQLDFSLVDFFVVLLVHFSLVGLALLALLHRVLTVLIQLEKDFSRHAKVPVFPAN